MQDDPVVVLVPLSQAVEELKAHPYAIANPSEVEGLIEWMLTADHIKGGAEGGYIEQTDAWVPLCNMDVRLEEQSNG